MANLRLYGWRWISKTGQGAKLYVRVLKGGTDNRKNQKKHSPQFKAKLALAAIQNNETIAQIANRFGVHPTMVSNWKRQMLRGAADIFDKNYNSRKQAQSQNDELYCQIGKLKIENDFLSRKFGS
jgi:transposase-like protein